MKFSKSLAALFGLLPLHSHAQLDLNEIIFNNEEASSELPANGIYEQLTTEFSFRDEKRYRQVGPNKLNFELGNFELMMFDGGYQQVRCLGNFLPKNTRTRVGTVNCNLGTTALLSSGDLDGDGLRDPGGFISISRLVP